MGSSGGSVKKPDLKWMDIKVTDVPRSKGLYNFCCWFLGKKEEKLSYKEIYLLLYGFHRHRLGAEKAKEKALRRVVAIYQYLNNNKIPKGFE